MPKADLDQETLQLLMDNIGNLEHPKGWIKHPVFAQRFAVNPDQVMETKRIFCEAIVLLLQKNGRLKDKRGRKAA